MYCLWHLYKHYKKENKAFTVAGKQTCYLAGLLTDRIRAPCFELKMFNPKSGEEVFRAEELHSPQSI